MFADIKIKLEEELVNSLGLKKILRLKTNNIMFL